MVRLPQSIVDTQGSERFAAALSAEIRLPCKTMYSALNQNRLYNPSSRNRFELGKAFTDAVDPSCYQLPIAQEFSRSCIALPHRMLLADTSAIEHVAAAFEKVARLINNRRA